MAESHQEYIKPGDLFEFTTNLDIVSFEMPTPGRLETKSIISVFCGDLVRYIGSRFKSRTHGLLKPVLVHEFMIIRLNDGGNVIGEYRFFMPNVETILKWAEKIDEEYYDDEDQNDE